MGVGAAAGRPPRSISRDLSRATRQEDPGWPRRRGPTSDRDLRKLGVGPAPAGRGAGDARALRASPSLAGSALIVRGLNDRIDRTLAWVHVVEPVVGADRLCVCGCSGALARTRKRDAWSARRALHFSGQGGAGACTYD